MITVEQKLAALERLIEDFRWARDAKQTAEYQTYIALKAMAAELRTRLVSPADTRRMIGGRIAAAVKFKTPLGYEPGHLTALGQDVISRWPVIEAALEKMEQGR